MASSGNFCTLNPLTQPNSGTFSEGNLLFTHTASAWRTTAGTHGMTSGKWYWEAYQYEDLGGNGFPCGIYDTDSGKFVKQQAGDYPGQSTSTYGASYVCYTNTGTYSQKRHNGSTSDLTLSDGDSGDIWQCALDLDNGKIWFGKNNSWDNSANPALGSNESYSSIPSSTWVPITCSYNDSNSENYPQNFGQDSTFSGRISAGGNADENGFGDFKYAPPTGFLALCSGNLPISDDIDPAQTDDDFPGKQFNAITYTGTGSTNAITGLGFQPDLIWIKRTNSSATYSNGLVDSSRGRAKVLISNLTTSEYTSGSTQDVVSIDSDGFTLGTNSNISCNASSDTHVAWCWRANGGTTSSNSDGTITTTLQVGKGFSIGTYTGTGSNATVGHGLGAVPDFTIFRERSSSGNWVVTSQKNMSSNDHNLYLQLDNAQSDGNYFQNTAMTSSVISIGTHADINGSSNTYVMYNWINVEGYQKFGTYTGNGNADGPFIYTGFRPRMFFVKLLDSAGDWWIQDTARSTFNPASKYIAWNRADGEATGIDVDFLSNGFKIRTSSGDFNSNGAEILYGAWGDVPFKYNNTF